MPQGHTVKPEKPQESVGLLTPTLEENVRPPTPPQWDDWAMNQLPKRMAAPRNTVELSQEQSAESGATSSPDRLGTARLRLFAQQEERQAF